MFDAESRQLQRGGVDVHVSTKAFDLLKLLIEARPRVLSKADLQEALWPGIFVSEANLFTLVSELRAALDEDARRPLFVRTVHGVGYAFGSGAIEVDWAAVGVAPAGALVCENRQFLSAERLPVVGADPGPAVTLDSTTVSRHHARFHVTAASATVEDLDSKDGTFVNDLRVVARVAVVDGDRIRMGSVLTTF